MYPNIRAVDFFISFAVHFVLFKTAVYSDGVCCVVLSVL